MHAKCLRAEYDMRSIAADIDKAASLIRLPAAADAREMQERCAKIAKAQPYYPDTKIGMRQQWVKDQIEAKIRALPCPAVAPAPSADFGLETTAEERVGTRDFLIDQLKRGREAKGRGNVHWPDFEVASLHVTRVLALLRDFDRVAALAPAPAAAEVEAMIAALKTPDVWIAARSGENQTMSDVPYAAAALLRRLSPSPTEDKAMSDR